MIARVRSRSVVVMSSAFGNACWCRSESQLPDLTPIRLRALYARDVGGQFRRQQPIVGRRDRWRADGRHAHCVAGTVPTTPAYSRAVR